MVNLKEKYPVIAESKSIAFLNSGMAQIIEDVLYDVIVFDKIRKEPWNKEAYEAFFGAYEDFVRENPVLIIPKHKGEFVYTDIKTPELHSKHFWGNCASVLDWEFYEIKPLKREECIRPHVSSLLNIRREDIQKEYARRVIRRVPVADRVIEDIDWSADIEDSKKWYDAYTKVFPLPPFSELVGKSVTKKTNRCLAEIERLQGAIKAQQAMIELYNNKLNLL